MHQSSKTRLPLPSQIQYVGTRLTRSRHQALAGRAARTRRVGRVEVAGVHAGVQHDRGAGLAGLVACLMRIARRRAGIAPVLQDPIAAAVAGPVRGTRLARTGHQALAGRTARTRRIHRRGSARIHASQLGNGRSPDAGLMGHHPRRGRRRAGTAIRLRNQAPAHTLVVGRTGLAGAADDTLAGAARQCALDCQNTSWLRGGSSYRQTSRRNHSLQPDICCLARVSIGQPVAADPAPTRISELLGEFLA